MKSLEPVSVSGTYQEPFAARPRARSLYFPHVDVARAAAVTLVLVYHLIVELQWISFPSGGIFNIFRIGWIGVDLFFVISGFVISLSLTRTIDHFGINGYKKPYFRNRLSRIVPLYFLTSWCYLTLVDPQLFHAQAEFFWQNILSHVFFIHNFWVAYAGAINGPAWTIAIEMQFYVLMAIVFRWLPVHRPVLVCCLFVAAALVWRAGVWYTFDPKLDVSLLMSQVQQLPGTLDAFGLGCAMALIVRNPGHALHRYLQVNWKNAVAWLVMGILLGTAGWKIFWSHAYYWSFSGMVIFFRLLLAAAFASWVCFFISLGNGKLLARVLAPVSYVGKISYGIYLWHMLVILSVLKIGLAHPVQAAKLVVLLTVVISAFTWHFFEHPLIKKYHDKPAPSP